MKVDYALIGKRIKKLRKATGWTQDDLCFEANISKTHMSHIENGTTKLSLPVLIAIANTLETTVDNLLCDSVKSSNPVFSQEISDIINDCSSYELRVMVEAMQLIKTSLRGYRNGESEKTK